MEKAKSIVCKALKDFFAHPISAPFLKAPPKGTPDYEIYFKDNSQPVFLEEIYQKIVENKIVDINQIFQDINNLWAITIKNFGENSPRGQISEVAKQIFNKLCPISDCLTVESWSYKLYRLRGKLTHLSAHPPTPIRQKCSILGTARSLKPNLPALSEQEYQKFIQDTRLLLFEEDETNLIKIIKQYQPDLDLSNYVVDVSLLSAPTIQALKAYTTKTLTKRGIKCSE